MYLRGEASAGVQGSKCFGERRFVHDRPVDRADDTRHLGRVKKRKDHHPRVVVVENGHGSNGKRRLQIRFLRVTGAVRSHGSGEGDREEIGLFADDTVVFDADRRDEGGDCLGQDARSQNASDELLSIVAGEFGEDGRLAVADCREKGVLLLVQDGERRV